MSFSLTALSSSVTLREKHWREEESLYPRHLAYQELAVYKPAVDEVHTATLFLLLEIRL